MKAFLDGIFSIDLPNGPPQLPEDPSNCWIVVQADIGVIGGSGADTFTFNVCTLKKLQHILNQEEYQLGRHLVLVEEFDWEVIERAIKNLLAPLQADDWESLATKIGRFGEWEFEDYVECVEPR